jgi:hypothetical protein
MVCVDRAGTLADVALVGTSGDPRVDALAMESARRWRFSAVADTERAVVCTLAKPRWQIVTHAAASPEREAVRPITAVEKRLIAGDREPHLPDAIKRGFVAAGHRRPVAMLKVCLDPDGIPDVVEMRKSTGMVAADQWLVATVHTWRFAPTVDEEGKPRRVCTAVMFRWVIGDIRSAQSVLAQFRHERTPWHPDHIGRARLGCRLPARRRPRERHFGRTTVSMAWITPFFAGTSAWITFAPSTFTPDDASTLRRPPCTVLSSLALATSPEAIIPGTT